MTVYTHSGTGQMQLWIPQRFMSTTTNSGMLDSSVAGGIPAGVEPFECLVNEAAEEASLPEALTRARAKPVGCVTDYNIKDGSKGLLQPSLKYVYDMEVDEWTELHPADSEVETFQLMTIEEAKAELVQGKFKPMSAMVTIDFFVRQGVLTMHNEKDYMELVERTHRRLPFPTSPV
jgi:8-oxo-dGTP pyrophosphatase MutT (NUDIX family)